MIADAVTKILQRNVEDAKSGEKISKLLEECQQELRTLERTVRQEQTLGIETDAKVNMLKAKHEEAESRRREWQNKPLLQKIWAWICWLISCGSDD
ncbi:hypothetical protein IFR05_010544 [Cadophora sp. M221]|nr:hypothetical protein IFR05_010544 [Cadophora sp. M221]